jgi:hypothetical protein
MPTPTYTPLATVTLGSSASSVTFSSIPGTYRDLILVARRTTTTTANLIWRINNDGGNNYNRTTLVGQLTSPIAASNTNVSSLFLDNATSDSSTAVFQIIQFMDYSTTGKQKTVLTRENTSTLTTSATCSHWASTAAITTLNITASTGQIATGSTFNLYGIAS